MPDTRSHPLDGIMKPGRFGADKGAPGLVICVLHPDDVVMAMARKGKAKALAARVGSAARWAGPDQYYVYGEPHADLAKALAGIASCSDQSHARCHLRIEGTRARDVLAKGTPIDLHPREFAIGKSALTQMAHVGVHLTRVGEDAFELSVFRGFAESFWEWLMTMSEEYGVQVG